MTFNHLSRVHTNITLAENLVINLSNDVVHYLKTVLRLKINDQFRIFNDRAGEYLAEIISTSKNGLEIRVLSCLRVPSVEPDLVLGICLIKIDKMLDAINMAVQLGVTEITPLFSERSQMRSINYQRFLKCIREATEQSERLLVPHLNPLISLHNYEPQPDEMIIYANEQEVLGNNIRLIKQFPARVSLIIGPEGGFTSSELKMLALMPGSVSISLGNNILRTETATATALAQIQIMR